jgi:hypothetical protein
LYDTLQGEDFERLKRKFNIKWVNLNL